MAKRKALTTATQVRALKPGEKSYVHSIKGSRGLYVKVQSSGHKAWFYRCRRADDPGKFQWMRLGYVGDGPGRMSLSQAREELEVQRQIRMKHGSAKEYRDDERQRLADELKAQKSAPEQGSYTVKAMCLEYVEEASRKLKSWSKIDQAFERYVYPNIGDVPAGDVTRKDIIAMLDPLNKAGKTVMANRLHAYLRRVYNWAANKDKVGEINPCNRIEMNKEKAKERALSGVEIRRLLTNLPGSGMTETCQDLLVFILLTGCRPSEAAGASIEQIDAEAATLTLTDTKNSSTHIVPLSAKALEIALKRQDESRWLFPMASRPGKPMRGDSLPRPLREAMKNLNVLRFSPHDLRRTFATGLAGLQCPPLVISLALNHTIPGVTAIYNRYSYAEEIREWVCKWGAHIEALTDKPAKFTKAA